MRANIVKGSEPRRIVSRAVPPTRPHRAQPGGNLNAQPPVCPNSRVPMASPQRVVHQIAPGVPSSGEPVVDFGASLFLGPWEALKGAVLGVAGVFIDPIQGAAEGGLPGFLWGVGTGVTGVVLKPVAGALTGTHVGACRAPPLLYHGPSPPRPPPPPTPHPHTLFSRQRREQPHWGHARRCERGFGRH
jgi:hypothetical protein